MVNNPAMPRYSFSLGKSISAADSDATEDLADDQAAMDYARLIAKNLARSRAAMDHLRIVVRNEAGDEIGDAPLQFDLR